MGLFSKKKEERKFEHKEPFKIPQFHENFPKYESTVTPDDLNAIKDAVKPQQEPLSQKRMTFATIPLKDIDVAMPQIEDVPKKFFSDEYNKTDYATAAMPSHQPSDESIYKQEKTLFIKIDRYKESIEKIEQIKMLINEVNKTITRINELKSEEDSEISYCNNEINKIKEDLNSIDRILFGR
ncbi:hypothetical protein J4231_01500 [Candidatus Woesearchaeota archaeon]|nr:hypothetical protein [Candidatus Woesearchaeota archaeon]